MPSLYEHAGREAGLHRLEAIFYASVLADPLLQPLFGAGKPEHVDHLTAFTAESFGGPDRFTKELGFDHLIAVNTRAPLIIAQEYARHRIALGGGGAIVNLSSRSSFTGFADHAAYCASKGALDAMTRVMANELGPHGIRVNCVNPAVTLTAMAVKAWSDPKKSIPMLARMPLGRFIEPDEVAEVVLFLLSDGAAMVTGVALPIDAGFGVT